MPLTPLCQELRELLRFFANPRTQLGRIKRLISLTPSTLEELQRRAAQQNVAMGYVIDSLLTPEGRTA